MRAAARRAGEPREGGQGPPPDQAVDRVLVLGELTRLPLSPFFWCCVFSSTPI
ncbi:predicted protein [Streptomyces sp. C]|nr:predicted protein [Streptomyces sp. C]